MLKLQGSIMLVKRIKAFKLIHHTDNMKHIGEVNNHHCLCKCDLHVHVT